MGWRDKIRNPDCDLCSLHEGAEHVCLMGAGKRSSKIMVVGEAPGAREDEQHVAFVGPAGKLLDQVLAEAGISRDDCYITNVAKCRPPENRTPERGEIKTCVETYFWQEVDKVSPQFILLLGNSALRGVVGKSGITKHRGTVYERDGIQILPTFHPAAILRNPRLGLELRADIQRFGRMYRGESSEISTKTRIIRTKAQLKWLRSQLMKAKVISYDLETTGLEEWRSDSQVVSMGFSWEEGAAAVVPIHHSEAPWRNPSVVLRYLKPALEREEVKYVAHNGKFDSRWLARQGIFVPQTFDTMLAAHMLDENRSKGLKPLSQVILGADAYDIGEDVKDAYNAPLKRLCIYNGKDCDYTLRLYNKFRCELKEEVRIGRVFKGLMMPASNALTQIEMGGIYIDQERLDQRYWQCMENRNKLRNYMGKYLPQELKYVPDEHAMINFNSPQQVAHWLFNHLELPVIEETVKGAPSTKESVLLRLAKQHPAPLALLKYRKWTKYMNTYLHPFKYEALDERSRIHPTYKLYGTVTGRLSCSGPNLQQVPRDSFIRGVFGAPPGWIFVEADYSQIELRVAAMLANEQRMLRRFLNGEDIHLSTAVAVSGKSPDEITSEERKKAKAVGFGFLYGMGAQKFVDYARDSYDVEVSLEEAETFRDRFFSEYPRLKPWHDRQRRLANRYERVHSPIGRVRHLPDVRSEDKHVRAEAERQAINSPVQSFASDLMLLSLVRLSRRLGSRDSRIVGTVHDSLLFEIREEAVDEVVPQIIETMEDTAPAEKLFGAQVTVPIEVEVKMGQYWSEGEKWG